MRFRLHQGQARTATLKLLLLFAALVAAIALVVNAALALAYLLMLPASSGFPPYFFATNTALVVLFVLGGAGVESLRMVDGGARVAAMAGARPVQASASTDLGRLERRFANLVTEMALASRMRQPPQPWVLHRDDSINAFAAGWTEKDHVVCVTRGALERLTREELQGVVAHEFAHLRHGDTVLNMRLIGLVWGLQMIHGFGRALADRDESQRLPASALFGFAFMGVGWLGWLGGQVLQATVSRQREFHADAAAVEYTRVAMGLSNALRKVAAQARRAAAGRGDSRHADRLRAPGAESVAHLLLHHRSSWLQTHPPLHERVQRLVGRSLEPLPDDVLPTPADEPLIPFAPAQGPRHATGTSTDAERIDPMQPGREQARAIALRDALARIDRWHGPLERRAAMLAMLIDRDDQVGWLQWEKLIAHPTTTRRVRSELATLDVEARIEVFKTLVVRQASASAQDRAALRRDARALAGTASSRLRRLALSRLMRTTPSSAARARQPLADNLAAAVMSTAALAGAVATKDPPSWLGQVRQQLGATDVAAPRQPLWAMRGMLRMAPMDRPRVVNAWVKAARKLGLVADDNSREALHFAALVLDTPTPSLR